MTPSVEGRAKATVTGLLALASGASGALVGFVAGVAWVILPLPELTTTLVLGAVAVAVMLDLAHRTVGGPRPLAVGRQVPQEWSRIFAPPVVAVLYGARLGIGPLTILSSWLWWAMLVVGAAGGPWLGAAAGAAFALSRTTVMVVVAEWARGAMPVRIARVRAGERVAHVACSALVVLGTGGLLLL